MLVALSPENGVSAHILNGKLGNPARSVHIEIPLEQDSAALKSSFMAAVVPAR
jgi:5-hydroxyisourate hydrolase-like protein (transthyretin family)